MLNESRQLPFVGSMDRTVIVREGAPDQNRPSTTGGGTSRETVVSKKGASKETKESKMVDIELPNYPYSRMLLYEQIKNHGTGKSSTISPLHVFIGPGTFLRFMQSFWYLFTSKAAVCERDIIRLNKVLSTLNKTRQDAENMKEYIQQLKDKCLTSEKETALLLEEVISKSMILEKLRAKYGLPGSLSGYIHREEKDDFLLPEEERKWLLDGQAFNRLSIHNTVFFFNILDEPDEYEENFKRMKEESLRSRQVKMQEEYEAALREIEKWRERLSSKRKEVEIWKSKVDKSCVERISAFQTPPIFIGQIMEMSKITSF